MKVEEIINKTIGLTLSGGGVRGMAHIGILKALNERDIYPDIISGVSAGAIVGALYANGSSPMNMLAFFKETPLFKYNFFSVNKPGLFDTEKYMLFFEKYFKENSFASLEKTLFVTATDLQQGKPKIFSSGELLKPLLASAALPPVFSPVCIDDVLYADGGIMNNFPVEPLLDNCEIIIGCYTSALKEVGKAKLKNSLQLTSRTNTLMLHSNSMKKLHACDILFRPKDLEHIGILDKKGIEKAFIIGYEYASRFLDEMY